MKISYNWLQQYIDIPESPEEIGETLTSTGLEVESINTFEEFKGGLKGLVIGEVLTAVKHPNADKLTLTTVNVGMDKPLSIVCGAPNVAEGQKVVVALTGTTLYPFKGDPFVIKSSKIRGEVSEGMLCAKDEIGMGEDHSGIIVLDNAAKTGTTLAEFYKTQSDSIFEIGLTPNRADAASHLGVVRDIKAAKKRKVQLPSVESFKVDCQSLEIPVTIENIQDCPRYSAVTLSGITVAQSPPWLTQRLKSIGLTSINNIVDITNFVLHELGQPLHAFDADQIEGKQVIVKTLPAGTKFITLDEKERSLKAEDLMICNVKEPMCIAGVFGGLHSGISHKTKNIFLESACFSPASIRKTGMNHGLKTDASFRFERGTDPNITVYALKRAALMIKEIAGGIISSEIVDVYPVKIENRIIHVKDKNVNRLIGKEIPRETVFQILELLDCPVTIQDEQSYYVTVPAYRVDIMQEADIVEEILRIYGFNKVELLEIAGAEFLAEFPAKDLNKYKQKIGELLTGNGFFEILTNSLTSSVYHQKHQLQSDGDAIEILNKLSEEQGVMRQSLLFTGLEVCAYNINRKQKDLKLYEFGKTYSKRTNKGKSQYEEDERLVLFMTGNIEEENWQIKNRNVNYYDLAQRVSNILEKSSIQNIQYHKVTDPIFEFAMQINSGTGEMGRLGKLKLTIVKDLGIKQEIFYADLSTSLLFKPANPKFVVQEVPRFPEVKRDLSLVLDKRVSFSEIRELGQNTEKQLIKEIIAFDVYEGDKIPKGKKAYALRFTLLDSTKTLTDEEIDKTMGRLMAAFESKMGAVIRK